MKYGELWQVAGLARDRYVVIVSADPVNAGDQFTAVQGVPVLDALAAPAHLLIATITHPVAGQAVVAQVGPVRKTRLAERVGVVPGEEMDHIRRGLTALFDL